MSLVIFFALLCAVLIGWGAGAPIAIVFPGALAAWIAFTFVVRPKLRTYKSAMGIDDALIAVEARGARWLALQLKGLKVLLFGFLTSMVPFLGSAAQWLSGQDLNFFFDPSNPRMQQIVMFAIGALVFVTPFLTSWLHSGAIADAAQTDPRVTEKG